VSFVPVELFGNACSCDAEESANPWPTFEE
jgi:hypothetical protein